MKSAKILLRIVILNYRELIRRNPDDDNNYKLLIKANKIDASKDSYEEAEIETIIKLLEGDFCLFNRAKQIIP